MGNTWACRVCRCRFYTIPYIGCPYEVRWVCGCKNAYRTDKEMLANRIFLSEEELEKAHG